MLSLLHTVPTLCLQIAFLALCSVPAIWLNDSLKLRRARSLRTDRKSLGRFG